MKGQIRTYHIMMVIAQVVALIVWFFFMTQVVLQLNFNDCLKDKDRLLFTRLTAEAFSSFTEDENVESVTALGNVTCAKVIGNRGACLSDIRDVMPSGLSALGLEIVAGKDHFLPTDTNGVLIPASMARLLFESSDVIDKELRWRKVGALALAKKENIVGVYADLPSNCEVNNLVYKLKNYDEEEAHTTLTYYIKVKDVHNLHTLSSAQHAQFRAVGEGGVSIRSLFEMENTNGHASHVYLILLLCSSIVIIIVLLGNLCTAMAEVPSLMKTYNTLMVLGTTKSQIRWNLMMRYVLMSIGAFAVAALIVGVAHFNIRLWMIGVMLGIAISMGIISGIYPAYYATHQPLTIVTRGQYAVSRKGRWMRMVMLCIMFAMTFVVLAYFVVVSIYANKVTIEDSGTRYLHEINYARQMAVFAASCLFITLMCLISIAIIERKYMLHSMRILHIIGMTRGEMLMMKIRHYAWLMLIGGVIALPFVWILGKHWFSAQ